MASSQNRYLQFAMKRNLAMQQYPVLSLGWSFRMLLGLAFLAMFLSGCSLPGFAGQPPLASDTTTQRSGTATQIAVSATPLMPAPTHMAALPAPTLAPTAVRYPARAEVPALCYHHIRDWMASDTPRDRPYIVPRQ